MIFILGSPQLFTEIVADRWLKPSGEPPYCGVRKIGDRRQPLTPTLSPLLRRGAREKIEPAVRAV
ncbi:MAG: hypothetical protein ABSG59_06340 [Verrucomicrobiota bacterium]